MQDCSFTASRPLLPYRRNSAVASVEMKQLAKRWTCSSVVPARGTLEAYGLRESRSAAGQANVIRLASTDSSSASPTSKSGGNNATYIYKNVYQAGFAKGIVDRNIQAYLQFQRDEALGEDELRRLLTNIKYASDGKLVQKMLVRITDSCMKHVSPKNITLMLVNCKIHRLTSLSLIIYKKLLALDAYIANVAHLTVLLQTMSMHGRYHETYQMCREIYFDAMYGDVRGDPILTSTAFTAMSVVSTEAYSAKPEMLDFLVDVFDCCLRNGSTPTPAMISSLLLVCGKCKKYDLAESILDKMVSEYNVVVNVSIFNSLMVASNMSREFARTLDISNKMAEMNIEPNFRSTMNKVIAHAGLGKDEDALEIYYAAIKASSKTDTFDWSAFNQVWSIMHKTGGLDGKDRVPLSKTGHSILKYAVDRLLRLRLKTDRIPQDTMEKLAFYLVLSGNIDRVFNVITGDGHSTALDDGSKGTLEHFTRNAAMWTNVFKALRHHGLIANMSALAQRLRAHYMGWPLEAAMGVRVASVEALSYCGRPDLAAGVVEEGLRDFVVFFSVPKEEFVRLYLHSASTYEPDTAARLLSELLAALVGTGDDALVQHLLLTQDAKVDRLRFEKLIESRKKTST